MRSWRRAIAVAAVAAGVALSTAEAAPDAKAQREIDHLLAFVAASPCRFVRSGTEYDGREARDHLARKFDAVRTLVSTADQFVDRIASSSSVTGRAYLVRCGDRETTARDWLGGELARLRRAGATAQ